MLDEQSAAFRDRISHHWHTYPAELSALPRKTLALKALRLRAEPHVSKKENPAFHEVYKNTQDKIYLWLLRMLAGFHTRIQQKERLTGKKVNVSI